MIKLLKCYILKYKTRKYKTRYILHYDDKNAELNKCVLSFTLKTLTDLAHLTSNGKAFQSLGAAQVGRTCRQVLL